MCDRTIIDSLRAYLLEKAKSISPSHSFALALSGGIDSTVLLYAMKNAGMSFAAYHVNHGLSPHADAWAEQVTAQCNALSVPLTCIKLTSKPSPGESIEAWARHARYAALIDALPENSIVFTAHHEGDQAETLLLQLMRGSGPKGLSGIAPTKILCHRKHIELHRPFINVSKHSIEMYAKAHELIWVEDESNAHLRFDRNFMRHQALPLLASRVPHAVKSLSQSAAHLQEQQTLIDVLINEKMPTLQGSKPGTLSIERVLQLPDIMIKAVLRHWLAMHCVRMPSSQKLNAIMVNVLHAKEDAHPRVLIDDWAIVRYRDSLHVLPQEQLRSLSDYVFEWDPRDVLCLPHGAGTLSAEDLTCAGIDIAAGQTVSVRFRQEGDTVYVPGVGRQPLKKWFQSHHIPVWERDRIPLINGTLILKKA